jgi:hypothetical protein
MTAFAESSVIVKSGTWGISLPVAFGGSLVTGGSLLGAAVGRGVVEKGIGAACSAKALPPKAKRHTGTSGM